MTHLPRRMARLAGRFGLLSLLALSFAEGALARDLATMSTDDITVLQRRLTDAGCYKGSPDGKSSAALDAAVKACPDQDPILRIETGMHVATIKRVGVDASCRLAATGSDDKTVRLWSMPDGRPLRTQRLPIGDGNLGKVNAVAVSPDGKWVAAGGWDAFYGVNKTNSIYVFDAATGQTMRKIGVLRNVVNHLAFSANGQQVAAVLGGGEGFRIFDVASGREEVADRDYGSKAAYGVTYLPNGGLAAVGYDGFLRRYAPDGRRLSKIATRGGKEPFSVSVDPAGKRLAVGLDDTGAIDFYDLPDLRFSGSGQTTDINGSDVSTVAWSADGRRLYAGGRYGNPTKVRVFDVEGKRLGPDLNVSESTIISMAPCRDSIIFGAGDPAFGLISANGDVTTLGRTKAPDMRGKKREAFAVSNDGRRLRFGLGAREDNPVLFDLTSATLSDSRVAPPGLVIPNIAGAPNDWENSRGTRFKGQPIILLPYETSRAFAARGDEKGFVLAADFRVRAFDNSGKERWAKEGPGVAWGINLARDGEIVLVAYDDGTVRWHRWSDGQELLALFVNKDTKAWVVWTPTGYYNASPGAEDMIGWHVNRGWEQPADFFPASRFRERFYRPDIVNLVLDTMDEGAAVRQANLTARKKDDAKPITAALPPVVTILSPTDGSRIASDTVDVTYTLRSPSGQPVDRVDVLIDGARQDFRGLARPEEVVLASGETRATRSIPVPARDAEIALVARSGDLASTLAKVKLVWGGGATSASEADLLKPSLYALVVGVSDYANPDLKLGYAAKDARDLAAALREQSGGLYRTVDVELLTDRDANALGVKQGLSRLRRKMTSRDLALVFLAGHGVTDAKGKFWYLTREGDPDELLTTAVSRDDIMGVVSDLPGKKLVLLDACHSGAALKERSRGAVDVSKALNDFALGEDGVIAFSSSTGREFSIESDELGNGAFTKALIEAIRDGKADLMRRGTITLSALDVYVLDRVKELTNGRQHPMMVRPATIDYPIALRK